MILIGRNTSPFVRRVAISLRLLGFSYEQKALSTLNDRDAVRAYNPLGRVPALVLDDGETLIDSTPILDYLDQVAGPEHALVPAVGAPRRRVLKLVALGLGVAEKTLACYIERNLRPSDKQHQVLLDHFAGQALAGLAALEAVADGGWLYGERVSQADVTLVAAMEFLRSSWPDLVPVGRFPKLEGLRDRASALPAFAETRT
ncbi:MAG TPA: glutathione S-transferase family protein [Telmatospirillum sp.]|nr:glutathione S-transferase family protein [Telmatospirillum sp.]